MDTTLRQAKILAAVGRKPGISQPELFREIEKLDPGLLKINVDQAVFRMLDRSLLTKKKKGNGGPAVNLLDLSKTGREALKYAEEAARFILGR